MNGQSNNAVVANGASGDNNKLRSYKWIYWVLHIAVLILSLFLIISISIDTFSNKGIEYYSRPSFVKTQLIICCVFLFDYIVEFVLAKRKVRYFFGNLIFLIVSIPYLWILEKMGYHDFSPRTAYLLQYIPLVRGGYALAIVIGWFTYSKASGLFVTYLATLVSTVYFASLVFYMFEHNVNALVNNYSDALWWASMDVTTVGSNIIAVTPEGRVLSVLLAALGMMMFPIFTVYVTSLIQRQRKQTVSQEQANKL